MKFLQGFEQQQQKPKRKVQPHMIAHQWSAEKNISPEAREKACETKKKKTKKKRELLELLNMTLKGGMGSQIVEKFEQAMGVKPRTIAEALHLTQIAKAIANKDTFAYQAVMTTSGLNKPIKIDATTNGESLNAKVDYSKLSTEELLTLKALNEKLAT